MYEIKSLIGQQNKNCNVVNKIPKTDCMWFQNVEISLPNQDIIFLNYWVWRLFSTVCREMTVYD